MVKAGTRIVYRSCFSSTAPDTEAPHRSGITWSEGNADKQQSFKLILRVQVDIHDTRDGKQCA